MGGLTWWHILIVVLVGLILFGGKRLPEAARGLGRSLRILKAEVGAMTDDKKADSPASDVGQASITPTPLPPGVGAPIPPVQAVAPAKITINGKPID